MLRAFDLETWLIQPGVLAPPIVCGSSATIQFPHGEIFPKSEVRELVAHWLLAEDELTTAHGVYDMGCLAAAWPDLLPLVFKAYEEGRIHDVHVRQALIDIGRGRLFRDARNAPIERYSLSICSELNLGQTVEKENTWRMRYAELDGIPLQQWPEEAREYPRNDARVALEVFKKQGEGSDPGVQNLACEAHENRANWALHLMSCWGIRTDPLMVAEVVKDVTAKHEAMQQRFTETGIIRGEGWCRREKQCEGTAPHKILETCWRPWLPSKVGTKDGECLAMLVTNAYQNSPPRTPSGEISADRDTLFESGDDLLMEFGEAGKNEKEYSTYLEIIEAGAEIPINPEANVLVKTTRTSYRKPNLQNLPRGGRSRECFVPRPGCVYCSVDYPGLELVTLAENLLEMFGQSALAEMLKRKEDPHGQLAARMLGIPYVDFMARYKAGDAQVKLFRQSAKPVNFGMGGGMGEEKLTLYARQPGNGGVRFCLTAGETRCGKEKFISERLGKPLCSRCVEVARQFRNTWFSTFPEMRGYFEKVGAETEDYGTSLIAIPVPRGEPVMWLARRSFTEAANAKFQGRAARLAKDALWRVSKACYVEPASPLYGSRPVVFVHDEILSELPESRATKAAREQANLMGDAMAKWCPRVFAPHLVPEPAIMRRWFKGAEKVEDKEGNLVPWWPKKWEWGPDQEIMQRDLARAAK